MQPSSRRRYFERIRQKNRQIKSLYAIIKHQVNMLIAHSQHLRCTTQEQDNSIISQLMARANERTERNSTLHERRPRGIRHRSWSSSGPRKSSSSNGKMRTRTSARGSGSRTKSSIHQIAENEQIPGEGGAGDLRRTREGGENEPRAEEKSLEKGTCSQSLQSRPRPLKVPGSVC
jgi:hypothetical protein